MTKIGKNKQFSYNITEKREKYYVNVVPIYIKLIESQMKNSRINDDDEKKII